MMYNAYGKFANNSPNMYAKQVILYSFERGEWDLSNELKLNELNQQLVSKFVQYVNLQFLILIINIITYGDSI